MEIRNYRKELKLKKFALSYRSTIKDMFLSGFICTSGFKVLRYRQLLLSMESMKPELKIQGQCQFALSLSIFAQKKVTRTSQHCLICPKHVYTKFIQNCSIDHALNLQNVTNLAECHAAPLQTVHQPLSSNAEKMSQLEQTRKKT